MKLTWFKRILLKNKKWILSKNAYIYLLFFLLLCNILFTTLYSDTVRDFIRSSSVYTPHILGVLTGIVLGIFSFFSITVFRLLIFKYDKIDKNIIKHQTENLQEYENIRTQFTLHNIKNAVINANNYMDILRKGKMDLTIATENLQGCLDRIDEILEVFKDSDYAQKRTEFRLEELFTTFQMLYHSTMIRRDIQFEVIYQNDAVKSQIVNQSFYDMFQIFNNLVINSRKAIEQKEIKQITVFANMDEQKDLIFKVCDTGVGISSSNKSKIFDLKFSTTGGDGIGLVYVKEVLKEMGGSIRLIESFQNFSTTFEVRIPIQKM
jgi:signal transduction histidine kinase